MSAFASQEIDYVIWQNRAFSFYVGARVLYQKKLFGPAAYSAAIAIELLLKATLIYWDQSFIPQDIGHGMAKLERMVKNKAHSANDIVIPEYFYHEKRYLSVSRYPTSSGGLTIPATFLSDLDHIIASLIFLVPFQHNTMLKSALSGKEYSALIALRYKNSEMFQLRKFLGVNLKV